MPELSRKDAAWTAFLGALVVIFFYQFVFLGRIPLNSDWLHANFHPGNAYLSVRAHNIELDDPAYQFYPLRMEAVRQWKSGRVPLWNTKIMCGSPLLADGIAKPFDPLIPAYLIFGGPVGRGLELVGQFLIMITGGYFLGRVLGFSRAGAAVTAIAYTFNLLSVTWMELRTATGAFAFFPWALLFLAVAFGRRSAAAAVAAGICAAFMHLGGHPQFVLYGYLLLTAFGGWRAAAAWREEGFGAFLRTGGLTLLAVAVGAGLAAVETLPLLELARNSARNPRQYEKVNMHSAPLSFLPYIYPNFFGNPAGGAYFGAGILKRPYMTATGGFVGASTLCMALAGLVISSFRWKRFFVVVFFGVAAFLVAQGLGLGRAVSGYTSVFSGMDSARAVFMSNVAAAVLAGAGVSALGEASWKDRRMRGVAVCLVIFGAGGVLATGFLRTLTAPLALYSGPMVREMSAYLDVVAGRYGSLLFMPAVYVPLLFFAIAAVLAFLAGEFRRVVPVAAAVLVGFELLFFGIGYNPFVKSELIAPRWEFIDSVEPEAGRGRILGVDTPYGGRLVSVKGDCLVPNYAMLYGLEDVRGDESLRPTRYFDYMHRLAGPKADLLASIHLQIYDSRFLDWLNVRYVLSAVELDGEGLEEVFADGKAYVYENRRALPRAFLVGRWVEADSPSGALKIMHENADFDASSVAVVEGAGEPLPDEPGDFTAGNAEIVRYSASEVVVRTSCPRRALLVLGDSFYPGWRVTIDGGESRILPANCVMRGVFVPGGAHEIVFTYRPRSFTRGVWISLGTLLAVAIFLTSKAVRVLKGVAKAA